MKLWEILAVLCILLACAAFVFRTELQVLRDIAVVRGTQQAVADLMREDQFLLECMRIVEDTEKPQLIQAENMSDDVIPESIQQYSPTYCMITTNSLSFTWQTAVPLWFWNLEVSRKPIDLAEMKQALAEHEYTRDLTFRAVDHGEHWVITETCD